MRTSQRVQAELQATAPGLLDITGQADNLWFLGFLTCKADLRWLKTVRQSTLLKLPGVGVAYAAKIAQWQRSAVFASSVAWAGPMIQMDARRMLELREAIAALDVQIEQLVEQSPLVQHLLSMPGFGPVCAAELAAEVGNIDRFTDEASFAVYLGVAPLDQSSGKRFGAKLPRQINPYARDALLIAVVHHMAKCRHRVPSITARENRARPTCRRYAHWRVTSHACSSACSDIIATIDGQIKIRFPRLENSRGMFRVN